MSYNLPLKVTLAQSQTGLTLAVQLKDVANVNVGSPITTGFVELGGGQYFLYPAIPDGHEGFGVVQTTPGGVFKAAFPIHSRELENADVKTSTRLATAGYTAPDNATIATISSALTTAAANVASILGKLSGITSLGNWLRLVMRKSGGDATALSEVGGTFDNTTDSLEALRDRGDLAWAINGGGANQVTITVTASAVPVVGALVTIQNSGLTTTIAGPVATNASGQVVVSLDNGSYKILIASSTTYAPFTPQTLTVSGTTTASCTLTAFSPTAPTAAGTCVVYGYLLKKTGAVAPNVEVTFELLAKHGLKVTSGQVVAQADVVTATTNSLGYFTAELIRSALLDPVREGESTDYRARSVAANLDAVITVPSAASVDFQTLL